MSTLFPAWGVAQAAPLGVLRSRGKTRAAASPSRARRRTAVSASEEGAALLFAVASARGDDLLEHSSSLAAAGSEEGARVALEDWEDLEEDLEAEGLKDAARMLILCGTPGSGKSTLASALRSRGWTVVSQDALGSRKAVERVARGALRRPKARVVVDRCNQDAAQRAHWTRGAPARARLHSRDRALSLSLHRPAPHKVPRDTTRPRCWLLSLRSRARDATF